MIKKNSSLRSVTIKYLCPSILFLAEFIALRYPKYFNYARPECGWKNCGASFSSDGTNRPTPNQVEIPFRTTPRSGKWKPFQAVVKHVHMKPATPSILSGWHRSAFWSICPISCRVRLAKKTTIATEVKFLYSSSPATELTAAAAPFSCRFSRSRCLVCQGQKGPSTRVQSSRKWPTKN